MPSNLSPWISSLCSLRIGPQQLNPFQVRKGMCLQRRIFPKRMHRIKVAVHKVCFGLNLIMLWSPQESFCGLNTQQAWHLTMMTCNLGGIFQEAVLIWPFSSAWLQNWLFTRDWWNPSALQCHEGAEVLNQTRGKSSLAFCPAPLFPPHLNSSSRVQSTQGTQINGTQLWLS